MLWCSLRQNLVGIFSFFYGRCSFCRVLHCLVENLCCFNMLCLQRFDIYGFDMLDVRLRIDVRGTTEVMSSNKAHALHELLSVATNDLEYSGLLL